MENELVAAVAANAQSGNTVTLYLCFEVAMLCCALLIEFSAVDESGGAGGVVLRENNLRGTRMSWRGLRGRGRGRWRGLGRSAALPPGPAAPEAPVTSNLTRTREVQSATRLNI